MAEYVDEFRANPITFLRGHSLSPPDGTPGDPIKSWNIAKANNILVGGGNSVDEATVRYAKAGVGTQWINFKNHPLFPQCLTVELSTTRTDNTQIPIYWLPWASLHIVKTKIPPVPGSLVDPEEDQFPRFFMTAGINGCSVFVAGPPQSPTIFHAGITGKLARNAKDFWREQLGEALHGTPLEGARMGEVHKDEYMERDAVPIRKFTE